MIISIIVLIIISIDYNSMNYIKVITQFNYDSNLINNNNNNSIENGSNSFELKNNNSNIISLGNSSYNIINNLTRGINSNLDNSLSNWQEVYISFLVEKKNSIIE